MRVTGMRDRAAATTALARGGKDHIKAFSGEVCSGSPQKMRQINKA
jgi:hypothetical protein